MTGAGRSLGIHGGPLYPPLEVETASVRRSGVTIRDDTWGIHGAALRHPGSEHAIRKL